MSTLSRRRFAALAVSAPVWVTPLVYSIPRASAANLNSAPKSPRSVSPPQMGPELPPELPGTLAYTGQETRKEVVLGAAALGAGAAIVAVTKRPKREAL